MGSMSEVSTRSRPAALNGVAIFDTLTSLTYIHRYARLARVQNFRPHLESSTWAARFAIKSNRSPDTKSGPKHQVPQSLRAGSIIFSGLGDQRQTANPKLFVPQLGTSCKSPERLER